MVSNTSSLFVIGGCHSLAMRVISLSMLPLDGYFSTCAHRVYVCVYIPTHFR